MTTATPTPLHHSCATPHGELQYWEYHPDATVTIVAIHGYRGTHHGLERIIAKLPAIRFIVPDLPGFGESATLATPHTIEAYADTMAAFLEATKLTGHAVLGHSMGSIVAADLAARYPKLLDSLILINPIAAHPLRGMSGVIVRPSIVYHWLGGKLLPGRLGRALLDSKAFLLLGSVLMAKTRDQALRQWIHNEHTTRMTAYANPRMLYEAYLASLSGTVRDRAAHIKAPTLLIAGEHDELAPPAAQRQLLEALPSASLVMIDNVGHLIHYEKPAEAAAAITAFLTPSNPGKDLQTDQASSGDRASGQSQDSPR